MLIMNQQKNYFIQIVWRNDENVGNGNVTNEENDTYVKSLPWGLKESVCKTPCTEPQRGLESGLSYPSFSGSFFFFLKQFKHRYIHSHLFLSLLSALSSLFCPLSSSFCPLSLLPDHSSSYSFDKYLLSIYEPEHCLRHKICSCVL